MKKIFFPGVLLALMFIFSCSKDEFTEEDAVKAQTDLISYQDSIDQVRDSLEKVGGILQFSVSVIPVDGGVGFVGEGNYKSAEKESMLSGATVSVSQHGQLLTATTDESGIAVFTDLRVGELNVSVRAANYTSVNFIVEVKPVDEDANGHIDAITPDGTIIANYSGVLRHAATMVPVFSIAENTSTISGVLTYETDLTNEVPEVASGVQVIAAIDVDDDHFINNYFYQVYDGTLHDYVASIEQVAYNGLTGSDVTETDGSYEIIMPSAADGLPIYIEVSDVVADQRLLVNTLYGDVINGVKSVRTLFGSRVGESPSDPTPSAIPTVAAAFAEFAAPTGVVTQQPVEIASAVAVIGESGIVSIIITDQGSGYTQAPKIVISGDGEGAEAVAYISQGKVTSIEITSAGTGYTTASVDPESFVETAAAATPIIGYGIASYVSSPGSGYKSTPNVVITSSAGSGASAQAIMSGYVTKVNVTNMGTGYVCPPDVVFERGAGNLPTYTVAMTANNPLHSIELSDAFLEDVNNWYEVVPTVEIRNNGTQGSGATAVVQLSETGSIDEIILSNVGAGYLEAPSVIISGDGTGAVAWATISNDGLGTITAINIPDGGKGYKAETTTIQISAPAASGTAPVVDRVVVVKPIKGITLTNPGSGYNVAYNNNFAGANDGYVNEPDVLINGVPVTGDDDVTVRPNFKLDKINVITGGSDYDKAPAITIVPKCGYGTGAAAEAEILYNVKKIVAVNEGSGYKFTTDVKVTVVTPPEGCETQAMVSSVAFGSGVLEDVVLEDGGLGYLAPPAVYLWDDANSKRVATLDAKVSNGVITEISFGDVTGLEEASADYEIEIVTFEDQAAFGTKAYAQSGKISFIELVEAGAGYTTEPIVKFERRKPNPDYLGAPGFPDVNVANHWIVIEDGAFIPAQADVVLADGRVVEINITNPGTGYYYPPLISIVVPDYLEVAKGVCSINADGYITDVTVTSPGMGYATAPNVTIRASVTGMGSGATATAIVKDGKVYDVVMTNNGSNYLGKNSPSSARGVSFKPSGSALTTFNVYGGKSYVKDIYLGTGVRNEDSN